MENLPAFIKFDPDLRKFEVSSTNLKDVGTYQIVVVGMLILDSNTKVEARFKITVMGTSCSTIQINPNPI